MTEQILGKRLLSCHCAKNLAMTEDYMFPLTLPCNYLTRSGINIKKIANILSHTNNTLPVRFSKGDASQQILLIFNIFQKHIKQKQ